MLFSLLLFGCAGTPPTNSQVEQAPSDSFILDHRDPRSIVEALLYAADTGDIDVMINLCDPCLLNDKKTEDLCFIESEDIPKFRKEFRGALIVGEVQYQYKFARVTVSRAERLGDSIIVLVRRYGNWYLYEIE
jgi:hypothetical protein